MADSTNQEQKKSDSVFSRTVVEMRFATAEEVNACLSIQQKLASKDKFRPIKELLVEKGCLTETQAERVEGIVQENQPSNQIPGFQLLSRLGSGAMGAVFKAKQLDLDRNVAIKVLPNRLSKLPEFVERFYREGKAAVRLQHPNIVQTIDVGQYEDRHYFVMELVEGPTVYDEITSGKIYEEKEALDVIYQVAQALEHAHDIGLIHRDVKPKNIMVNAAGVAKLADMGLARETTDVGAALTELGRAYGTPYYIAPEQVRGLVDLDFRSDIYSLGATFYHMVTGRAPFDGSSPTAVMQKHLKEPLTPPDHINRSLSAGVAEIIEVMMKKDREQRFQSPREMIEDLDLARRGEQPRHAHLTTNEDGMETLGARPSNNQDDFGADSYAPSIYSNPLFVWIVVLGTTLAISILANAIMLIR